MELPFIELGVYHSLRAIAKSGANIEEFHNQVKLEMDKFCTSHPEYILTSRIEGDGVRIWRLAAEQQDK